MTSTGHRTDRDHPILAAVSGISVELDQVEHAPAWSMSDEEARRGLVELARLEARVAALQLKVAAQADRARSATRRVRPRQGCGGQTRPG